jgi:hypothetical protein
LEAVHEQKVFSFGVAAALRRVGPGSGFHTQQLDYIESPEQFRAEHDRFESNLNQFEPESDHHRPNWSDYESEQQQQCDRRHEPKRSHNPVRNQCVFY